MKSVIPKPPSLLLSSENTPGLSSFLHVLVINLAVVLISLL